MLNKKIAFFCAGLVLPLAASNVYAKEQSLEQRVTRLEKMADNPVLIQLSRQLGEQQREIQNLHDLIDRLNYRLKQLSEREDGRYKESDDRLSKLETAAKKSEEAAEASVEDSAEAPATTNEKSASSKSSGKAEIHPATATELKAYQAAFSLMKGSKYKEAAKAFSDFRKTYPQSSLASNASYWAGEAYLVLNEQEQGLKAFSDVVDTYPDSSKAPAALLRSADTLKDMGKNKQAKTQYELILKNYPKSSVADKAKIRLGGLGK